MFGSILPIAEAMLKGYGARSIMKQLGKKYPKVKEYSQLAEMAGFSSPSILNKLIKSQKNKPEELKKFNTAHSRMLENRKNRRSDELKSVAKGFGLAGAAAYGLSRYANRPQPVEKGSVAVMPGRARPEELEQQLRSSATGGPPPPDVPPPFGGHPNQPQRPPFTPEQQERKQTMEHLGKVAENLPSELENQYPYLPIFVRKHLQAGVKPDEIYGQLQKSKMLAPVIKKIEEQTGSSYLDRIFKLAGMASAMDKMGAMGQVSTQGESQDSVQSLQAQQEGKVPPEKIGKGSFVFTPQGQVGQIADTKGTHGLIDVNGRKQQINLSESQQVPRDWENVQVDLSQVPEESKSANLNFVAPTEDRKNLIVRFWEGKQSSKPIVYIYRRKDAEPIDEETLYNIANEVDAPITQGMKFAGAWSPTGKSRGGAFHKRMKVLAQSIDEPDDPSKPYVFIRAPLTFEHGMWVAIKNEMIKKEEQFDAYYNPKRPKKSK